MEDISNLTQAGQAAPNGRKAPTEEQVLSTLQRRFKQQHPYTSLGARGLCIINPISVLEDLNDAYAAAYADQALNPHLSFRPSQPTSPASDSQDDDVKADQPHPYGFAGQVFSVMALTKNTQAIVYNGVSGAGKSFTHKLVTQQLLRLSTLNDPNRSGFKLADKVRALDVVLDAFGNCKTSSCSSASQFGRYFELHFSPSAEDATAPHLAAAQILTFGLNKSRIARPQRDERIFNVFYQLVAGASSSQRQDLALNEEPSAYALMANSATASPLMGSSQPSQALAADRIAFDDLVSAFNALGFKQRHLNAIFRILSAILLLGNIHFVAGYEGQNAQIDPESLPALEIAAALLAVQSEDLERVLTNKSRFIQKDYVSFILKPEECSTQRNALSAALYSIVFAYIVESANARLFPGQHQIETLRANGGASIVQLDLPGFQTRSQSQLGAAARRTSFIQSFGDDSFPEFCANAITQECLQHWLHAKTFDDESRDNARIVEDGVTLIPMEVVDRSVARMELVRGGVLGGRSDAKPGGILGGLAKTCSNVRKGKSSEKEASRSFVAQMRESCKTYSAFVAHGGGSPDGTSFGIQHFGGTVAYEAGDFVERGLDLVDSDFVTMLRGSDDTFVARLLSGPGMATEVHPNDPEINTATQISSQPLRLPTPPQNSAGVAAAAVDESLYLTAITPLSSQINTSISQLLKVIDPCQLWTATCLLPNASNAAGQFDPHAVKAQIKALQVTDSAARLQRSFVADFSTETVLAYMGASEEGRERLQAIFEDQGLTEGTDYVFGTTRVWLGLRAFQTVARTQVSPSSPPRLYQPGAAEEYKASLQPTDEQQAKIDDARSAAALIRTQTRLEGGQREEHTDNDALADGNYGAVPNPRESISNPFQDATSVGLPQSPGYEDPDEAPLRPTAQYRQSTFQSDYSINKEGEGGYDDGWGADPKGQSQAVLNKDGEIQGEVEIETVQTTKARRVWLVIVWATTFYIPNFLLKHVGRMKRPDVRQAWREKYAICFLILLLCGIVVFYIIGFGLVLCPEFRRSWNEKELGYHQGEDDYWVAVRGEVYDLTDFWQAQHSDIQGLTVTGDQMLQLGGQDLSAYFPPPIYAACPNLVDDDTLELMRQNFNPTVPGAEHVSGAQQDDSGTELNNANWLWDTFYPFMKQYHKGSYVYTRGKVSKEVDEGDEDMGTSKTWAIYENGIYDLTDYFFTQKYQTSDDYAFLDAAITDIFQSRPGQDVTSAINSLSSSQISDQSKEDTLDCMKELFLFAKTDPRETARCEAQPYMLLAFSCLIIAVLATKFLASLQFHTKRVPEPRDKFAILQVPCYTEGEDSIRKTVESLASLKYDDKRKLLVLICDGMIVGSGNDKPTPRICLDILGATAAGAPDPDPHMFKSVGEGSKQINYGKVYSGLYEHEGHVVPYLVVVKVGKPSERSRPGNRGKRDSQIVLMRFLNRVHEDSEMAPMELEMYHQIKNVIGVDPSFYEYMLCVDADTEVHPDSLNRLIAVSHDDQRILGLCGETKISNERTSLTTMIQVYEYFISHHMAKAFESLFGSVTCLPGCFTLYRIRTHEGKPLLVAKEIVDDYSENVVDTLHKKNLLHLGEDRYLTTLILKYFPKYKTKFTQDALAYTVAPDEWGILLSQRRRWINSTVHNLVELLYLNDMCGTLCFSMRFVVMLDLISTLILPATTVYLVYLIVSVATGSGSIPLLSIVMLGAVYGLQVIIFLLKREWAFIGWLVIYLLAYPLYSFFLPIYSWWHFDDFSWGNTRVVVGEGKNKKVLAGAEEEPFDDSMIPMRRFADYQAQAYGAGLQPPHTPGSPSVVGSPGGMGYNRAASVSGFSLAAPQASPGMRQSSFGFGMPAARGSTYSLGQPYGHQEFGAMPRPTSYMSNTNPFNTNTMGTHSSMMFPPYAGSVTGIQPPSAPWAGMHTPHGSFGGHSARGSEAGGSPFGTAQPIARPQSTFSQSPSMMMGGAGGSPGGSPGNGLGLSQNRQSSMSMLNLPSASNSENPSDEELRSTITSYLATQDLMNVTKRTAREAVAQLYPRANLSSRKELMNQEIETFCSGS